MASLGPLTSRLPLCSPSPRTAKSQKNPAPSSSSSCKCTISKRCRVSATPPQKLLSGSLTAPHSTISVKFSGSLMAGAAILSLILGALICALKLPRRRRSSIPCRSFVRHSPVPSNEYWKSQLYKEKMRFLRDLRMGVSISTLSRRGELTIGQVRDFGRLPVVRASAGYAPIVPRKGLVGAFDSRVIAASVQIEVSLRGERVPGTRHFESLMLWELFFSASRKWNYAALMLSPVDSCDIEDKGRVFLSWNACDDNSLLLPADEENGSLDAKACGGHSSFQPESAAVSLEKVPQKVEQQEEHLDQCELQAAMPAVAMVAGVFGAVVAGESGFFEMVGFVAVTSFFVYDLLWASKRKTLWAELVQVTDRENFLHFLLSRKMMTPNA